MLIARQGKASPAHKLLKHSDQTTIGGLDPSWDAMKNGRGIKQLCGHMQGSSCSATTCDRSGVKSLYLDLSSFLRPHRRQITHVFLVTKP